MTEYRIAEQNGEIWIEESKDGKNWHTVQIHNVPRYHDTVADARSWVATIKRGVVYHDAEDAPNLAQDERKAEDDTLVGTRQVEWFLNRVGKNVENNMGCIIPVTSKSVAQLLFSSQYHTYYNRYSDPR